MKTTHRIEFEDARTLGSLPAGSVDLIITSPPYPMIEMWDGVFGQQNPAIAQALQRGEGRVAFDLMHRALARVWRGCHHALRSGGVLCINIGDATRKVGDDFQIYASHARILQDCLALGFQNLPNILWRKLTNAPNKFMGSGMLPPGAYVTLEHEYILILRKGGRRLFPSQDERALRRESAYFWEERNVWFSDLWTDLGGTDQGLKGTALRRRSAAFPFDLAYRLINMFSIKGDRVLDPFLGTGTTTLAAMVAGRHSLGYELDANFRPLIEGRVGDVVTFGNRVLDGRLRAHLDFVERRRSAGGAFKNVNLPYGFPCISRQERELLLNPLLTLETTGEGIYEVTYAPRPQPEFCQEPDA
ncbi:MAG: DNA-methyltransferase [Anaerolineales bacterium]